jgi:hypothetical protein
LFESSSWHVVSESGGPSSNDDELCRAHTAMAAAEAPTPASTGASVVARRAPAAKTAAKTLSVKMGIVRRTAKDRAFYEAEAAKEREKLEGLIASGCDDHDETHQRAIVEETESMIPDALSRLGAAVEDLQTFLVSPRGACCPHRK